MNNSWDAWLAGFIDGEGCIRIDSSSDGPRVSIASTTLSALAEIREKEGGQIVTVKRYRPNHKPGYEWRFYSPTGIQELLLRLLPYFRVKAHEAELMVSFLSQRTVHSRAERYLHISEEEKALRHRYRLALQGAKA